MTIDRLPRTAILLCGGEGRRLRPLTSDLCPKSLFPVCGKPLMQFSLDGFDPSIIDRIIFAVHYRAEDIETWTKSANLDFDCQFSYQAEPGVLPAIRSAISHAHPGDVIVCNSDEIRLGFSLEALLKFHAFSSDHSTMLATRAEVAQRHRVLALRESDNRILSTILKPKVPAIRSNTKSVINAGLLILNPNSLLNSSIRGTDWSALIDSLVDRRELTAFVDDRIQFFNVGTPEEAIEAEAAICHRQLPNFL